MRFARFASQNHIPLQAFWQGKAAWEQLGVVTQLQHCKTRAASSSFKRQQQRDQGQARMIQNSTHTAQNSTSNARRLLGGAFIATKTSWTLEGKATAQWTLNCNP